MQAKTKNRLTIIITVLLFTSPVVVAYLLSSGLIDYQPEETKNNGHFVSPLVKLADYSEASWVSELDGNWTLIHRFPEVCVNQCQTLAKDLMTYRKTLGHRAEKLNLILLADGFNSELPDQYPLVKKVSIAENEAMKDVFNELSEVSMKSGYGMYVVAPEGYLMMAFSEDNTTTEITRDLSLLVKRKGEG